MKNSTPKKLILKKRTPTLTPFKCLKKRLTDARFKKHKKKLEKENTL